MDNNEINKCEDLSGKKISSPNGNRMSSFITSRPWLSGRAFQSVFWKVMGLISVGARNILRERSGLKIAEKFPAKVV